MTAFLIIALVLCSLLALIDMIMFFGADRRNPSSLAVAGSGILHLVALIPTIIALALALAQ